MARRFVSSLFVVILMLAAACSSKPQTSTDQPRTFKLEGKVISIDQAHKFVTVDSKAIPDFMDAMTMDYSLPDDTALKSLKPGDQIQATLKVTPQKTWLENVQVTSE